MSYSIFFDKWGSIDEEYDNLTWEEVSSDDESMCRTDQFSYWLNENYPEEGWEGTELAQEIESNEDVDIAELMEEFRDSEEYYELGDTYFPIYNYVHVLSSNIYKKAILMIDKYVGNVVVVHLNEIDADVLALAGCGMDLSDNIELAYYLADGESPIKASQIMSLSEHAEKILHFCRKQTNGRVSMYEIERFIDCGYEDEKEE